MRAVVLLVLLALAAPAAAAQSPVSMTARLNADPPQGAIAPLTGVAKVPLLLLVSCPPTAAGPGGLGVTFAILSLPAWAQATVEPDETRVDGAACAQGEVVVPALVTVRVSELAPAFEPGVVEVEAVAQASLADSAHARTQFPVTAAYYSALDVARAREILTPDADGVAAVTLGLLNLGNGVTRVVFEVGASSPDLAVALPRPLVLGSRIQGGERTQVPVTVVRTQPGELPSTFSLQYRAFYALDPAIVGEHGELAFQVLPAPWMEETGALEALASDDAARRDLPFGALLLVGGALVLAAFSRKR